MRLPPSTVRALLAQVDRRQNSGPPPSSTPPATPPPPQETPPSSSPSSTPPPSSTISPSPSPSPPSASPLPSSAPSEAGKNNSTLLIVVSVCVIFSVAGIILLFTILPSLRSKYPNPKYIPTKRGKSIWRRWTPGASHRYDAVASPHRSRGHTMDSLDNNPPTREPTQNQSSAAPDRNTSVRSVITLPAYNPRPSDSEQTLGREGERGGIDVVVEFPETPDEIEARRELEMNSLFQIREARRNDARARADRSERRRAARAAGDTAALEQIRREREAARAARPSDSTSSLAAQVLADNAQRERDRRISSVSYASIGLARHDGSRVRAGSTESERPLLGLEEVNPPFLQNSGHSRGRSASSALSISTVASDHSPSPARGRGGSSATLDTINLGAARTASVGEGSSQHSGDLGDQPIPAEDPPGYDGRDWGSIPNEDAPPYESPVNRRAPSLRTPAGAPQLPVLGALPDIQITPNSPTRR